MYIRSLYFRKNGIIFATIGASMEDIKEYTYEF